MHVNEQPSSQDALGLNHANLYMEEGHSGHRFNQHLFYKFTVVMMGHTTLQSQALQMCRFLDYFVLAVEESALYAQCIRVNFNKQ